MTKTSNNFHVNVNLQTVADILSDQSLGGELIKNLVLHDKHLIHNFF